MRHIIILLVLAIALGACSSRLQVGKVGVTTAENSTEIEAARLQGIPFREMRSHKVHLYAYDNQKKRYALVKSEKHVIASPDEVLTLGADSKLLSDRTVSVQLNPDGSLKVSSLDSDSKALTTGDAAVSGLQSRKDKAKTAQDEADAELKTFQAENVACKKAFILEKFAQDVFVSLAPDAADKAEKERDLELAIVDREAACDGL